MFFLLALFVMFDGATPEDNYIWTKGQLVNHVNLTIVETENTGVECVGVTNSRDRACTSWRVKEGLSSCTIWIKPNEPAVVLQHEKLHCLDWQHGPETVMGNPMPLIPENVTWRVIQHIKR